MIECEKSKVSLIEKNILFIDVDQNKELQLKDYKEIKLASLKLAAKRDVFNLINLGDRTIPSREAREACARDTGKGFLQAEAMIIH